MGDDGDLQVGAVVPPLQGGQERQALEERMEEERGEPDLGGDTHAADAPASEEFRPERARADLEQPGQHEAGGDPEERGGPQRRQHLRQEVEGHDSRRRGECESARQLEQRGAPARQEGERPSEQR